MSKRNQPGMTEPYRSTRQALWSILATSTFLCFTVWLGLATPSVAARRSPTTTSAFNGRIAISSTRNSAAFDIYTINPDGSSPVRLTNDHGHAHNPDGPTYEFEQAWSPDGSKLAFTSDRDGDSYEIFTMNADGSNVQRLTNNEISDGQAAWSPDGTKIAFAHGGGCAIFLKPQPLRVDDDDPCRPYIYVMNPDGSNKVKVSTEAGEMGPVWSPDGSKIAFTKIAQNYGDSEIYVMNADGSNRIRLTNDTTLDLVSSWSPDGSKLAFASTRDVLPRNLYRFQIYAMNADGSNPIRLTDNIFDDLYPVFSPDGTMIAFQRGQSYADSVSYDTEIFVMNTDGSSQTNITNNHSQDYGPPAWQPLAAPPQLPPPAVLQFETAAYNANENAGSVLVTVTRSGNTAEAATVQYESADGTASEKSDYSIAFGILSFAAGETSKSFPILVTDDAFIENPETLSLSLHDLTGNAILKGSGDTVVSIVDNDTSPAPSNPVQSSQFFVRQHYYDFFNRVPDPSGFAFWVNNIESCGADAHCREVKRIDTSAAFFLSIEFQQTGYYVYRVYAGALVVPPSYLDFMRDTQEISQGLIVGSPGWEAQLDTNTQKFTEDFVSRAWFKSQYPEDMPAELYVDRIYMHQFMTPPPAERAAAIAAYGSGDATGRARALRIVANNASFEQLVLNQAFVLMQYYGYLRRTPDSDGYNFWLNKLNQFNGDFRKAEMVKAFIVSSEYRQRFGPQ
jgi:Tol biopolymer transport system component